MIAILEPEQAVAGSPYCDVSKPCRALLPPSSQTFRYGLRAARGKLVGLNGSVFHARDEGCCWKAVCSNQQERCRQHDEQHQREADDDTLGDCSVAFASPAYIVCAARQATAARPARSFRAVLDRGALWRNGPGARAWRPEGSIPSRGVFSVLPG